MTNGRGAGMASFMAKKKKYKFQVDICLEELLEVPFVSAVLFAKLRLMDGGNFQDYSSRQEVRDHKVQWGSNFAFPCKMCANASTGVMERCILRISIRKESRGGRSCDKLGFVDLNLAEYAGAGLIHKKALLEGYNTRHRQDNSMLKFKIQLNMISGDILFKAPSPSLKHKQITEDVTSGDHQRSDEFSSDSLAGSIASGSSGFGSLPKKRTPLLASDLVISQTLTESNVPVTIATDLTTPHTDAPPTSINNHHQALPLAGLEQDPPHLAHNNEAPPTATGVGQGGHSRNSSNTSQLSKASGYSSIHSHSHSRQSSSGDSGHIRDLRPGSLRQPFTKSKPKPIFSRTNTYPNKHRIQIPNTILSSPLPDESVLDSTPSNSDNNNSEVYSTPKGVFYMSQISHSSGEYQTPECTFANNTDTVDVFSKNFNALQKSASSSVVENIRHNGNMITIKEVDKNKSEALAVQDFNVLRSKSEFEIPRVHSNNEKASTASKFFKSDSLFSFLTPRPTRKTIHTSTPNKTGVTISSKSTNNSNSNLFKVPIPPASPIMPESAKATSLSNLRLENEERHLSLCVPQIKRNPSAGSIVISETGSLDRAKASYERRKKNQTPDMDGPGSVPGRVEITRVNPDHLIEELLKNADFEQGDDSAETSGLQLFIAKDGTAAVGNREVKSQMSTGTFKQVVMENNR